MNRFNFWKIKFSFYLEIKFLLKEKISKTFCLLIFLLLLQSAWSRSLLPPPQRSCALTQSLTAMRGRSGDTCCGPRTAPWGTARGPRGRWSPGRSTYSSSSSSSSMKADSPVSAATLSQNQAETSCCEPIWTVGGFWPAPVGPTPLTDRKSPALLPVMIATGHAHTSLSLDTHTHNKEGLPNTPRTWTRTTGTNGPTFTCMRSTGLTPENLLHVCVSGVCVSVFLLLTDKILLWRIQRLPFQQAFILKGCERL